MLHIGHAAEDGQHIGVSPGKAECPRSHAAVRLGLLQTRHHMVVQVRQTASEQRLHYYGRDAAFGKLSIEIFSVCVARIDFLGMLPVEIVELNLHEIPFVFVVLRQKIVEHGDIAVIGEAEVTDASRLALLKQIVEHAVVDITATERLHAVVAHADSVEKKIVYVVDLQFLERIVIHVERGFPAPCRGGEV